MNKLMAKITVGVASASLMATLLTPAAFAADLTISGNGDGSTNTISVVTTKNCDVTQKNKTDVKANIKATSDTGGNTASSNTNGGVTISTGDASSTVTMTVDGSSNTAVDPCCGCDPTVPPTGDVSGNGNGSTNVLAVVDSGTKTVTQKNKVKVKARIKAKAKTGNNTTNSNTGPGDVSVTTGGSTTDVTLGVTAPSNTL